MKNYILFFICLALVLSACGGRNRMENHFNQSEMEPVDQEGHLNDSFWLEIAKQMRFKKISPKMEIELESLIAKGCVPDYQMLENDAAYMYSIIPGGGQIYTGEPKKAFMYLIGSFLIIPYLVAFEDAQSSVDYINAKYAIEFCRKRIRLARKYDSQMKKPEVSDGSISEKNFREKNRDFMEQLMREHKLGLNP